MKNSNKMNEDLLRPINLSACLIFAHTHTHILTHTHSHRLESEEASP